MVKVITYGTYDLLHHGHIRLLERAKALGDYLIVGVTADDFDKTRGKINVKQSLMERIQAVKDTGLADEIIVEEYEGQKIDDIRRYNVDIFTVGSDWVGKFDYLKEFCQVVYLERTKGISSTELRSEKRKIKMGLVGANSVINKIAGEIKFVNGMDIAGIYTSNEAKLEEEIKNTNFLAHSYDELLEKSDAIYIVYHPEKHYALIKKALELKKHVICESPLAITKKEYEELFSLANEKGCVLFEAIKTAYSTAFNRLLLLVKSGRIGKVVSVEATCTSLSEKIEKGKVYENNIWNSICGWGPTALLPVFQILGVNYIDKKIISDFVDIDRRLDSFTKIDFTYKDAVATIKVGKGIKSEGSLVISGTEGYIYVPAPWWKTDYFEIRFEDSRLNKRYFYKLDGEGIRYELVAFSRAIEDRKSLSYINNEVSLEIASVIEDFYNLKDVVCLCDDNK